MYNQIIYKILMIGGIMQKNKKLTIFIFVKIK